MATFGIEDDVPIPAIGWEYYKYPHIALAVGDRDVRGGTVLKVRHKRDHARYLIENTKLADWWLAARSSRQ